MNFIKYILLFSFTFGCVSHSFNRKLNNDYLPVLYELVYKDKYLDSIYNKTWQQDWTRDEFNNSLRLFLIAHPNTDDINLSKTDYKSNSIDYNLMLKFEDDYFDFITSYSIILDSNQVWNSELTYNMEDSNYSVIYIKECNWNNEKISEIISELEK